MGCRGDIKSYESPSLGSHRDGSMSQPFIVPSPCLHSAVPLIYKQREHGFSVYVSADGKDDGGGKEPDLWEWASAFNVRFTQPVQVKEQNK